MAIGSTKYVYKFGTYTTKKPSGLTISRNNNRFTFSWKIGDANYGDGQELQWRVNGGTWTAWTNPVNGKKIGKKDTAAYIDLNFSNYFPTASTKLNTVDFRVRGIRESFQKKVSKKKKKKTTVTVTTYFVEPSAWETKTYTFAIPSDPKVAASIDLEQSENRTTFSVTEAAPTDTANQSRRVVWQSVLVTNCNYTDGSKATWSSSAAGWQTGTMAASGGSKAIDESVAIASGTHTRWFRAKAQGVHGDSAKWIYSKHVYAEPNMATITSATYRTENNTYDVTVKWTAAATVARPIDDVTIQYVIGTPQAGMTPPSSGWQDAVTLKDTANKDGATIDIPDVCGDDEALFVRVNTRHDNRISYSRPVLVTAGLLVAPSDLAATVDDTTHTATITCTHNSDVPDSFIAVTLATQKQRYYAAVLPHSTTSATIKLPANTPGSTITFTAKEVVGSYTAKTVSGGITQYTISTRMQSASISYGTSVPAAPTNVRLQATSTPENVRVSWSKTWQAANLAELSWADHEDAWESTDEPSTYLIEQGNVSSWNIAGLEAGKPWYVRVRLGLTDGDNESWGQYSDMKSIKLSSAPVVPVLQLSAGVITARGSVDASWVYVTGDGTSQASAKIAEVTTSGGTTQYRTIATTTTAQKITISARRQGWTTGTTHLLAVRVTSGSGQMSDDWSAPVPIIIANAVTCTISQTSLETVTETIDGETETFTGLTEMPLTLTVTGAKAGGITSVTIERADAYHIDRPDESVTNGYAGETIAVYSQTGEAQITISNDDLIGSLDDGAKYRIIASTQDSYGQSATATMDFRVKWADQAIVPQAGATVDDDDAYAVIVPMLPNDIPETADTENAVCDIYRLSVDKPVLIYRGATFGEFYVDPYPTIGEYGGHRCVYRTKNGDYITADNQLAWVDLDEADGDFLDIEDNIIEWSGGRILLRHNIDLSNSWKKDFTETQYLGGSVQGDWNPAVSREGTMTAVGIATTDQDLIQAMRRLAVHAGICHLRTKDGSNFACDIQVSESYKQSTAHKIVEFTLKITRVDNQVLDGMTLEEWEEMHPIDPDKFDTDNAPYLMRQTGGDIYDGD